MSGFAEWIRGTALISACVFGLIVGLAVLQVAGPAWVVIPIMVIVVVRMIVLLVKLRFDDSKILWLSMFGLGVGTALLASWLAVIASESKTFSLPLFIGIIVSAVVTILICAGMRNAEINSRYDDEPLFY